jgi:hypothetical protein
MTAVPPALEPPKDPARYRRRGRADAWRLAAVGALCAALAVAATILAPRMLAARPEPAGAGLFHSTAADALAAPPTADAVEPAPDASGDVARLNARVAALEDQEKAWREAASAALAAAALIEATQGSAPFAEDLAALREVAPDAPELAGLIPLSQTGAPTRAALAASFPDYAARAAAAARAPGEGAALSARIAHAVSRIISVRRVAETTGDGPDARLARAERLIADGDLPAALRTLDRLPEPAREAMAPWRAGAERRAEIDRRAAALRARAMRALRQARDSAEPAA